MVIDKYQMASEATRYFTEVDPPRRVVVDKRYAVPIKEWLLHTFPRDFRRALDAMGVGDYRPEGNDCDDFAILFMSLARVAHAANPAAPKGTTLAVGYFHFTLDSSERHAAICAVVWADSREFITIEPQTGRQLHLSQKERESCDLYYF